MKQRILAICVFAILTMTIVACGKKGDPQSPTHSSYPRIYPMPK